MFGRILAVLMVSALASFLVALISSLLAPGSVSEMATFVCQTLLLAFLAAFVAFLLGEFVAETIGRRRA